MIPELDHSQISREKLVDVFSRSLTTLDGLWFLAVEDKYGLDAAMELDEKVWGGYGSILARRVVKNFAIEDENPLRTLIKALLLDPLSPIYKPDVPLLTDNKAIFHYTDCPPQKARLRDGRGEHPCKPAGLALFKSYAEAIDPRIKVSCLRCPPDPHPPDPDFWCGWQFEL